MSPKSPTGMPAFTLIWFGQVVSLLGSAMTWFAFTIWAWQKTGQATALSTVSFFAFLPTVLFTPIAGTFVDRWSRKWVLLLSDLASALGTLAALILYTTNSLQIWHVYLIAILAGFFTAFQYPAYAATVTTMLPKEHYARAEGLLGLAQAFSGILAPVVAAALLGRIGMSGIMLIDLATFLVAFATLLRVAIPRPAVTETGQNSRGNFWQEISFGFRYIHERPSLRGLVLLFVCANFFLAIGATLMTPMILSRTGNSETTLATIQSVGALGGVAGGILLTVWGGPKRRIHGILLGGAGACLLGIAWLGLGRVWLAWAIGSFFFSFFEPFVEGGNLALWQTKVEADVQGRVISARQLLVQIPYLCGVALSGPLADYVIAPLMAKQAAGSQFAGSSMSIALTVAALGGLSVFLSGYFFKNVRRAEALLPDQPHHTQEA
jgi:MFS transporter, DHA3 family, macrolide efflux protein